MEWEKKSLQMNSQSKHKLMSLSLKQALFFCLFALLEIALIEVNLHKFAITRRYLFIV